MTSPSRAAFTLLEICLALAIGLLIIVLTVPSIVGLLAEQRLRESYARFDRLVAEARQESVSGQRECRLVWDKKGITLQRTVRPGAGAGVEGPGKNETKDQDMSRLDFQGGESFRLKRPAALQKEAPEEWAFWRNGTCEPVEVTFEGPSGSWVASYDPLTVHGTFLRSSVP